MNREPTAAESPAVLDAESSSVDQEEEEKLEKARRQIRSPAIPLLVLALVVLVYFINQDLDGGETYDGRVRHETSDAQRALGQELAEHLKKIGCELRAGKPLEAPLGWTLAWAKTLQPHLRLLLGDTGQVARTQAGLLWELILYALFPGFAGLYYRDRFKGWFVLALLLLAAIELVLTLSYGVPVSKPLHYPHLWFTRFELLILVVFLAFRLRWRTSLGRSRSKTSSPKYIVVCLDGTWNHPGQTDFGFRAQTNVYKLWKSLKGIESEKYHPNATLCKRYTEPGDGDARKPREKQVGLYYSGLGSAVEYTSLGAALGGAFGLGADAIRDRAYLDVAREYLPGDRIVIVGFSRGAAISRLLASKLELDGVPRSTVTVRLFNRQRLFWASTKKDKNIEIEILGCWDTVGSFGIPKNIGPIPFQRVNLLKNLTVSLAVKRAYHLVALDETRDAFVPTLMDPDPVRPERIVEVWFSGNHANVGGGYKTDGLSDLTLDFMLRRLSSGYVDDPLLLLRGPNGWPWEARRLARALAEAPKETPFWEARSKLTETQRKLVELRQKGQSAEEIAVELKLETKKVEEMLREVEVQLRQALEKADWFSGRPWETRWLKSALANPGDQSPLDRALQGLDEQPRKIVRLRYKERKSVASIAEEVGLLEKIREEAEKKIREEAEKKIREEAEKKIREELGEARQHVEDSLREAGWLGPDEDDSWGLHLNACNGDSKVCKPEGDEDDGNEKDEPSCLQLHPDSAGRIRRQSGPIYTDAPRKVPHGAIFHDSILERLQHEEAEYAPESLFQLNQVIGSLRRHILGQVDLLQGTASLGDLEAQKIRDWLEKKLSIRRWTETRAAKDESYKSGLANPWCVERPEDSSADGGRKPWRRLRAWVSEKWKRDETASGQPPVKRPKDPSADGGKKRRWALTTWVAEKWKRDKEAPGQAPAPDPDSQPGKGAGSAAGTGSGASGAQEAGSGAGNGSDASRAAPGSPPDASG